MTPPRLLGQSDDCVSGDDLHYRIDVGVCSLHWSISLQWSIRYNVDLDDLLGLSSMRGALLQGFRDLIYVWIAVLPELRYPVVKSASGDTVLLEPLVIGKAAAAAFHDEIEAILRGEIPNIHDVASLVGVK